VIIDDISPFRVHSSDYKLWNSILMKQNLPEARVVSSTKENITTYNSRGSSSKDIVLLFLLVIINPIREFVTRDRHFLSQS
jgi:hypothetical protein